MNPLTHEEFRKAIQKGQGRVVLHLKEHGSDGFRDDILHACVHNLVYDVQCEDRRDDWLMSLIQLTGESDFFREQIFQALPIAVDCGDLQQIICLVVQFARHGATEARLALYSHFDSQDFRESCFGGNEIIGLDGIDGLVHVAEKIGAALVGSDEEWLYRSFLDEASERDGTAPVLSRLRQEAETSENIRAFFQLAEQEKALWDEPRSSPRPNIPVDTILADIEVAKGEFPGTYTTFGRRAEPNDLQPIFERLLVEDRRDQLLRCLWVFRRREPPELHQRLFDLAESADARLQNGAIAALSQAQHPKIRDLAIHLLNTNPRTITREAIRLFCKNYLAGDHAIIEQSLFIPDAPEEAHGVGFDLVDLAKKQPLVELARCMEWVYENTPCSNCREWAFKELVARDSVPQPILMEAIWDCGEEIRALAQKTVEAKT